MLLDVLLLYTDQWLTATIRAHILRSVIMYNTSQIIGHNSSSLNRVNSGYSRPSSRLSHVKHFLIGCLQATRSTYGGPWAATISSNGTWYVQGISGLRLYWVIMTAVILNFRFYMQYFMFLKVWTKTIQEYLY